MDVGFGRWVAVGLFHFRTTRDLGRGTELIRYQSVAPRFRRVVPNTLTVATVVKVVHQVG